MKNLKIAIRIAIVIGILLIGSLFIGVERINAGHIGLRENLAGGNKGISKIEYVSGWQFYLKTATKIHELPVRLQQAEFEPFNIQAKGGTVLTLHPAFNYALNPGEAANALQRLGSSAITDPANGVIKTALLAALREATNTFTVDSILNNVAIFDAAVTEDLNKKLAPYFTVNQLTTGTIPDESLRGSIAAKAKAVQEALRIQSEQAAIKAQVENDLLEASRDSAVKVKGALAEAKSIQVVQEALKQSPQYVEKIKAERWNGALPTYMFGGGSTPFINIK
jgi:hypothetical protein